MSRRAVVLPPRQNVETPPPRAPEQDRRFEVLIVDDNTPGGTIEMAGRLARI